MLGTEVHDLSDDADYAAASQQISDTQLMGSPSITCSDGSKQSSCSEPEKAEIVYLKDNVTIHPTQYASDRISGRLKLIKQGSSLFMTWIPYKGRSSNARLSERDKNLYTIRAVPFADIQSICRHTPTIGWQYVIVILSSGLAFPPFYFYNGGVREFLAMIKQHVYIVRSSEDANVFLVNNFQDPLQERLIGDALGDGSLSSIPQNDTKIQKSPDRVQDISIRVLEKFSFVARFVRETTSHLFRESLVNEVATNEKRNANQASQDRVQETASNDLHVVPKEVPVPSDGLEFDKLSLVWRKPRQLPLGLEEWATFLDSDGRVVDSNALKKRIFYGGVEHSLRKEIWKFLLGYYAYNSTYSERQYLATVKKSDYEAIRNQWQSISPGQAKRFTKFRERKGLIDKDVVRTDVSLPFYEGDDNPNVNLLRRILVTYAFYNFDLGYCQGMSDLLSPILFVLEDESESFWCFVSLMERLGPNFNPDQSGMHSQLFALLKLVEVLDKPLHNYLEQNDCLNYFFCFRWMLIQFKREFEYEKVMILWEVLWTHYLSEHLHLYICIAILKRHRVKIMGEQMDFGTLMKFINELSGHIDLDVVLRDAEALCVCAGDNGAASIPPGTPPSLPVSDGNGNGYGSMYQQEDNEVLYQSEE